MKELFELNERVALVTGGTGGLGLEMARALREAGAQVALLGRNQESLRCCARELGALPVVADVASAQEAQGAVKQVLHELGRVDILVNAAGTHVIKPSLELSPAEWQRVLEVNLSGSFFMAQAVAGPMRAQGYGRIINIGSVMSGRGLPRRAAYAASKGGLVTLTYTLAQEWGAWGIRVNAIAPGFFHTHMTDALFQDALWVERLEQRVAVRRAGRPRDLAGAVVFLASPASEYVNGHVLYVDGGFTTGEPW
ncbi:MAG: gluconate 5-dehydrogenase [Meiothermus sp.]|nr:MAG: gluconate 5-dehydrogenase [Meiothermus sp.]